MRKIFSIFVLAAIVLAVAACGGTTPSGAQTSGKIVVAVGIVPEAAFVQKVGGDLVDVVTMVPPGNSPANYQPTAQQMQQLSDASIYFTLHMPTEDANILPKLADFNADLHIVDLRAAVADVYPMRTLDHDHDEGEADEHGEAGNVDPHIWLSPKRAVVMVQTIADELSAMDEANRDIYQANAAAYIAELEALDQEIQQKLSGLTSRSFLIYHAAYGYFADDYDLTMISIEIGGKQATAAELQQAIDTANDHDVKVVFYQAEFSDSQAQTVAQEIDGTVTAVAPLSDDYTGSLRYVVDALLGAQ